jgi:hydrogenase maturation protease
LKDEGVGVKVVEEFQRRYVLPDHVRVVDGGTQGLWLMSTLQQADRLIVVDAVLGREAPGTLYRLEREDAPRSEAKQSAHDGDLVSLISVPSWTKGRRAWWWSGSNLRTFNLSGSS